MYLQILLPVITALLFLLATNHLIVAYQMEHQEQVAGRLLHNAEEVSGQLAGALSKAISAGNVSCSPEGINELRSIRHNNKHIDDIGIIRNDHIICTAGWGKLQQNIPLAGTPYQTPNGYLIYQIQEGNSWLRAPGTVTTIQGFAVITPALSFTNILNIAPDFYIALTAHNGQRQFYSRGNEYRARSDDMRTLFHVNTYQCSQIRDLCVTTSKFDGGLRTLSWPLVALLSVPGIMMGFLLASLASSVINARKSLEKRFVRAVKKNALYMEYQPIVQVSDRKIVAFEALIRWQDKYFDNVSPELFLGIARRLGLYRKLYAFVMQSSLNEMHAHLRQNPLLRLSINVEDEEINDSKYLQRLVSECLSRDINHEQIKLEITESSHSAPDLIASFCQNAKKYGFIISLDDFGTGTSNIQWLTVLDFDEIKIDRIFIANIDDPMKRGLLISMVNSLQNTGKQLIFEGVETTRQFEFIRSLGKDFLAQGWYTGKPARINTINTHH